jgi:hypothetical protein
MISRLSMFVSSGAYGRQCAVALSTHRFSGADSPNSLSEAD